MSEENNPTLSLTEDTKKRNTILIVVLVVIAIIFLGCCCVGVGLWVLWENGDEWFGRYLSYLLPLLV